MFTNWLTGTTGGGAAMTNPNSNNENRLTASIMSSNPSNNNSGNTHPFMSTPPDVILEVGTVPSTVRFVAHSIVLGMHSGYLRSAIRIDDRTTSNSSSSSSPDFVVYLGNVTPEQFAPLLTYMYTGYLDLNIENIFGVLLATHVLHMPRALEICRAFLARAQTEGYLGARLSMGNLNPGNNNNNGNGKIIRPIASKPAIPNFGFLPNLQPTTTPTATTSATAMTMVQQQQQQLLQPGQLLTNFKAYPAPLLSSDEHNERQQQRANSEEIDVDKASTRASSVASNSPKHRNPNHDNDNDDDDDDEDEEVFIDSSNTDTDNDESEVIIECRSRKKAATSKCQESSTKMESVSKPKLVRKPDNQCSKGSKQHSRSATIATNARRDKRRTGNAAATAKQRSSSGLQIAKAPIPASQLDANEGSKVIIDVASCDGPVRFRRILNTAYGHKPEDFNAQMPERSQQSVSYSFHQQMARTINQQQRHQQMQQHQSGGEESENSESSAGSKNPNKTGAGNAAAEIYVCIYCKHTFKSQYCYQKHAKRHLNPLSMSCSSSTTTSAVVMAERCSDKSTLGGTVYNSGGAAFPHATSLMPMQQQMAANCKPNATELLRREVRPLDMNVQYYPCKTCGSKFPSYYFVHKHRKMCHADEEAPNGKDNAAVQEGESVAANNAAEGSNHRREDQRESNRGADNVVIESATSNINTDGGSAEQESKHEN